jgi:hypothetical protein
VNTLQPVPNSTGVLVLGILSIVCCWCWGIIGTILGIIALVLASKGRAAYKAKPETFTQSSLKNLNAGRVCAIIGTCLSGLYLVFMIIYLAVMGVALGTLFTTMPWDSMFQ